MFATNSRKARDARADAYLEMLFIALVLGDKETAWHAFEEIGVMGYQLTCVPVPNANQKGGAK